MIAFNNRNALLALLLSVIPTVAYASDGLGYLIRNILIFFAIIAFVLTVVALKKLPKENTAQKIVKKESSRKKAKEEKKVSGATETIFNGVFIFIGIFIVGIVILNILIAIVRS